MRKILTYLTATVTVAAFALLFAGGVGSTYAQGPPQTNFGQQVHSIFNLDFSDPADDDDVGPSSAGWQVDRRDVDTWENAMFDGDDRLHINIDESGPTTGFYDYQGKKYLPEEGGHWNTGHGTTLHYRFYIDPAWEEDSDGQQTGIWGVVANANEDIVAYPVLEYQDSDAIDDENPDANPEPEGAQFRMFQQTGEWVNLGLPKKTHIDPEEGGWVDVKARFLFEGDNPKVQWFVNGTLLATDDTIDMFGDPALFREPILNSQNFGQDEDYYYDDIILREPGEGSTPSNNSPQ